MNKTTFSANPTLLLNYGSTDSAAKRTNISLFNQAELFSNPKPTELLHHFIKCLHILILLSSISSLAQPQPPML